MTTDVVVANGVVNGVNGTTTPTSTSKPVIKTEVTRVEANGIEPVTNGESTVSDSEKVTNGETAVNGVEKTANDESTVKPEDQILDVKKVDTSVFLESMALALADKVKEKLEEKLEEEKKKLEEEKEKEKEDEEKKEEADEEKKEGEEETKKKVKVEDMTKEVCRIDGIYKKGERKYVPWDASRATYEDDEGESSDEYDKWVLVVRRVFGWDGKVDRVKLDVKSPLLKKLILEVCEEGAMETEKASIHWPNEDIFRFRDKLAEAAEKEGGLVKEHMQVLTDLINKEFASKVRDCREMHPKGVSTFEILREAYWKGDIIYDKDVDRAYRVKDVDVMRDWETQKQYVQITAEYLDYDGKKFGLCTALYRLWEFKGVKYLKDLEVFPAKFHPEYEKHREKLIKRGKEFEKHTGQHFMVYDGVALEYSFKCPPPRISINSRCMIDHATFNRYKADFEITVTDIESELEDGKLTDEHYQIITQWIPIFSFIDKDFYRGTLDNLKPISWNENVFEKLVLPSEHKELVRILVENHTSEKAKFDDFVQGKGKGLIAVLHGPPGVGKTMTAEAVAEYTRRPLYTVTSGELGSNPSVMEEELRKVLDLAKNWDAVLLLDEADVFLEQRTNNDLIRNSLVSIFLRQLEYYQGILFLTTNRVETFDEAFHSRIHISLNYHNLTIEAREKVWRNFAATIDPETVHLTDADYRELSRMQLNGRQIKNMFRTGRALAADKNEKVMMKHMKTVLAVMTSFDLARMQRASDVEKGYYI